MLNEKHIHRLVVVEKASDHLRPIGILSVTDLAKHVSDSRWTRSENGGSRNCL